MEIRNTKQMKAVYVQYGYIMTGLWHGERSLDEAYGRYSNAKARAWDYCIDLMKEYDGNGIVILGHNCMTFSVGFIGYIDGLKHFFYITRDHDRAMPLEKMDAKTGEVLPA